MTGDQPRTSDRKELLHDDITAAVDDVINAIGAAYGRPHRFLDLFIAELRRTNEREPFKIERNGNGGVTILILSPAGYGASFVFDRDGHLGEMYPHGPGQTFEGDAFDRLHYSAKWKAARRAWVRFRRLLREAGRE